ATSSRRRTPSRPSALRSLPNDLGDVGSQVAQGLLAALDRVVLLDRLVAQLLGGEHRAHLNPGRRAIGANVKTDSKAFGSPRDSPCSSAIRSGGAISVQEIHSGSPS